MFEVGAVGVHEFVCMRELATETDREELASRAEAATAGRPCDTEEAHAVGHLGDLREDALGLRERLVNVPQRTGAAVAREMEARLAQLVE